MNNKTLIKKIKLLIKYNKQLNLVNISNKTLPILAEIRMATARREKPGD